MTRPVEDGARPPLPGRQLEQSTRLLARARRVDASLLARAGVMELGSSEGDPVRVPVFAERAEGCYLWDVDGNRYVDFILAFGAVVLGHAHPGVTAAVHAELTRGVSPTLHRPLQLELAELLVSLIPGAEMALFLKTGSDATAAAVRVARAYTGRPAVLRWGYNGWHEWCAPRPAGLSPGVQDHVATFRYNDLLALEQALSRRAGEVACIIMMPLEVELPQAGFLEGARDLAHRHGALFVFDEVRSGFRLALGGAQEYFGVRADLAALSKAMANGHAISAVVGRREVLEVVRSVSASSLFFRSGDGMAAALATIRTLREGNVISILWERGRALMEGLGQAAKRQDVPVSLVGLPPMPHQAFAYGSARRREAAKRLFYAETRARGVLFHPAHHWFTCAAMTPEDIALAVDAAEAGYAVVAREVGGS
jgi:glutamate-1-semialdehyde aminotransferase